MPNTFTQKLKSLPRIKLLIIAFAVWQYISILGIVIFHFSDSLVWLNLGAMLAFILLCPIYESLLLLIISIPFYVALPNSRFDSLPTWRILFIVLFAVWFLKEKKGRVRNIKFLPWDKYLAGFLGLGLLTGLVFGPFKTEAVKQTVFLLNIYCLYLVLINTLKSKNQIFETIRYTIWAITIIVTLGFTQLIATFLTNLDVFWVYWASNVTKLYYGASLAQVSLYSNSWFSYSGPRELRMFSIMPDSQSFAYVCLIGLCMGTALTRNVFVHVKKWLWSGIRFAALGLILSGTRAVWVGMAAPFLAVIGAFYKNFQKHLAKKFLWPFVIVFGLFAISPLINNGLALMQVGDFKEDFLSRAKSIYNLNETSNEGRLAMWANSGRFALTHLWGVGFGNFLISFSPPQQGQSYGQLSNKVNATYNLPAKYVSAHSLYLQVLVETGIVGFFLFAAFWICALKYFWSFIGHYQDKEDFLVYFVAQAILMILWILLAAVFDITIFNDRVLMLFLINLGLAGVIVKRYHEYEE